MSWHIEFSKKALKQLKKIDKQTACIITGWLRKNVEGCENPRLHGKSLTGNMSGKWRYRVGDWRILCRIEDERLIVVALEVKHRSVANRVEV